MEKRSLLLINFPNSEYKQIISALDEVNVDVVIKSNSLQQVKSEQENLAGINLVLLKIENNHSENTELLQQVTSQFTRFPIILISEQAPTPEEYEHYNLANILDIRPLAPTFLVAKSIAREIKSQLCTYSSHLLSSQFKNETYRFDAFLKHTEDGFALIHNGRYWSVNKAYKRLFNIPDEENIINSPVLEFSSKTELPNSELGIPYEHNTSLESLPDETVLAARIQTRTEETFITTLYKTHCFVKGQLCTQILIHNPDAWSNLNKGFTDLRTFDYETGFYNKRFILEYIDKQLEAAQPFGTLAFIFVDNFQQFREQHSTNIDEVLRSVADLIQKTSSAGDILARYSDETFTLFSNRANHNQLLLNCQQLLIDVNNNLFGSNAQYIKLTVSIGVTYIDNRISNSRQLISQANKACDKASSQGGNQIQVFDSVSTPLSVIVDEEENKALIQSALEQERLHLLYQPIVDLSEKKTENYAVLLRIVDKDNSHIPPSNFILTAEKTGLISCLDEWVLKSTIEQIREASRQGLKRKFFISLSSVTYRNTSFIESLISLLKFYNIDSSLLVFQINFSDIQTDPSPLKRFISVVKNECGCQLAFDQIGFSEITDTMIKEYRVDYLKIDGSFSQNLLNNEESQQIIRNILSVTQRHNVKTIAKSVESANTLALLWNIGIDAVQGYFLQKPSDNMRFDFDLNH
ncbi:GGDEF-domain containing protein [Cycloclasticus sp. 46_120_T64]|nr:GGDEF-domain containing protein [Cycloclasticus sp. 46_120_T64]